jgi:hypothetical protein
MSPACPYVTYDVALSSSKVTLPFHVDKSRDIGTTPARPQSSEIRCFGFSISSAPLKPDKIRVCLLTGREMSIGYKLRHLEPLWTQSAIWLPGLMSEEENCCLSKYIQGPSFVFSITSSAKRIADDVKLMEPRIVEVAVGM